MSAAPLAFDTAILSSAGGRDVNQDEARFTASGHKIRSARLLCACRNRFPTDDRRRAPPAVFL